MWITTATANKPSRGALITLRKGASSQGGWRASFLADQKRSERDGTDPVYCGRSGNRPTDHEPAITRLAHRRDQSRPERPGDPPPLQAQRTGHRTTQHSQKFF
jgi:hypothetical protein